MQPVPSRSISKSRAPFRHANRRTLTASLLCTLCSLSGCQAPPRSPPSFPASAGSSGSPATPPPIDKPAAPPLTPAPPQSVAPDPAAPATAPATPPTSAPGVITLDPLEVTATRTDPVTAQLRQNRTDDAREAAIARSNREGTVSGALNGWKIPFFNLGLTADRLAHGADRRAEILALERITLLALREAKTKEERAALKADLRALRDLRRSIVAADPRP